MHQTISTLKQISITRTKLHTQAEAEHSLDIFLVLPTSTTRGSFMEDKKIKPAKSMRAHPLKAPGHQALPTSSPRFLQEPAGHYTPLVISHLQATFLHSYNESKDLYLQCVAVRKRDVMSIFPTILLSICY